MNSNNLFSKRGYLCTKNGKKYEVCLCLYSVSDESELFMESSILSQIEKNYFDSMRWNNRKVAYLLGRLTAKKALYSIDSSIDFAKISISNGIFNQPIVNGNDLKVSIAHSNKMGVSIAFHKDIILGIDIETVNASQNTTLMEIVTNEELEMFKGKIDNISIVLTILWTIKEALGKALKTGITIEFNLMQISQVSVGAKGDINCKFKHFPQYSTKSWIIENSVLTIAYPSITTLELI